MSRTGSVIRVLHVDDDPAFRDLTVECLERETERFEVETVPTAETGLDRIESAEFDCVVSDYEMAGRNGIEFLEVVRERWPDLPFILFTGKGSEEVASEAISAGVTDYLQKGAGTDQFTLLSNRITNAVDQYRSERVAERTRQRLLELTESTDDVFWTFDGDLTELLFVNTAYESVYGRPVAALEADPESWFEAVHPDDRERVRAAMDRLSDGEAVDIEYRVDADPEARWVWMQGEPVFEDGEVARIVGFSRDITDRRRRKWELRRYERIFESLSDGVYVLDDDERLVYVNESYASMRGVDRGDLLGTDLAEWADDDAMATVRETRREVAASDRDVGSVEVPFRTADGDEFPVEVRVINIEREDGTTERVGVVRDITDRKERERALQRQNDRLEEFAGVVSHDLRNPLEVAETRLELAQRDCDSDHLDHIDTAHDRMETLIEDILTMARQGRAVEETDAVSLATVAESAWGTVETGAATLEVATDRRVHADESRLRQLFANLIRNAVEHGSTSPASHARQDAVEHGSTSPQSEAPEDASDAADDPVTVTVGVLDGAEGDSADVGGDGSGFYVADDGQGIPPEERDQVFESGFSTSESGTGFGLNIVARIAEAHGWRVDVTESADGGARFEVRDVDVVDP